MFDQSSLLLGYLDPGTGAIILQVIAAVILSTSVMFRRYLFSPILSIFGRKNNKDQETNTESEDSTPSD